MSVDTRWLLIATLALGISVASGVRENLMRGPQVWSWGLIFSAAWGLCSHQPEGQVFGIVLYLLCWIGSVAGSAAIMVIPGLLVLVALASGWTFTAALSLLPMAFWVSSNANEYKPGSLTCYAWPGHVIGCALLLSQHVRDMAPMPMILLFVLSLTRQRRGREFFGLALWAYWLVPTDPSSALALLILGSLVAPWQSLSTFRLEIWDKVLVACLLGIPPLAVSFSWLLRNQAETFNIMLHGLFWFGALWHASILWQGKEGSSSDLKDFRSSQGQVVNRAKWLARARAIGYSGVLLLSLMDPVFITWGP